MMEEDEAMRGAEAQDLSMGGGQPLAEEEGSEGVANCREEENDSNQ